MLLFACSTKAKTVSSDTVFPAAQQGKTDAAGHSEKNNETPTENNTQTGSESDSATNKLSPEEPSQNAISDSKSGIGTQQDLTQKTGLSDKNEGSSAPVSPKNENVITLSVQKSDGSFLLPESTVSFEEGESVLEVLIRVGKEKNMPVVFSGGKKSGYVEGIGGLFEFDEGPQSGWVYSVNGVRPGKSSGSYLINKGDTVKWEYILTIEDGLG